MSEYFKNQYEKWVKETKRSGSVVFRQSVYEFFDWMENGGGEHYWDKMGVYLDKFLADKQLPESNQSK